jgi:hypothetical protein
MFELTDARNSENMTNFVPMDFEMIANGVAKNDCHGGHNFGAVQLM